MKLALFLALSPLLGAVSAGICCGTTYLGPCDNGVDGVAKLCCYPKYNAKKRNCKGNFDNYFKNFELWSKAPSCTEGGEKGIEVCAGV